MILDKLVEHYFSLNFSDIHSKTINRTRLFIADLIGVAVYGKYYGDLSPITETYILKLEGAAESTLIGLPSKVSSRLAAFGSAVYAHSVELDDGHRMGTCHPGCVIIPTALAIAERENSSFENLIKSIVCGYDLMCRIATSINPSHLQRGFHSTGTCGVFGSALTASILLELNAFETINAISISALQSSGFQEMLYSNPMIKPIQPAKAADSGILSAELAKLGAKGPASIFEGKLGFFKAMSDKIDEHNLWDALGQIYEIDNCYTKLYPTCRHSHAAIDLALEFRYENPGELDELEKIQVETYDWAIQEVGQIIHPENKEEAMFSMAFSIALALHKGKVTLEDYTRTIFFDKKIVNTAYKVSLISTDYWNNHYPKKRGAKIIFHLKNGKIFEKETHLAKGEPENPIEINVFCNKFKKLTGQFIPSSDSEHLWNILVKNKIENVNLSKVYSILGEVNRIDKEK